jgi:hypothetical protein
MQTEMVGCEYGPDCQTVATSVQEQVKPIRFVARREPAVVAADRGSSAVRELEKRQVMARIAGEQLNLRGNREC